MNKKKVQKGRSELALVPFSGMMGAAEILPQLSQPNRSNFQAYV